MNIKHLPHGLRQSKYSVNMIICYNFQYHPMGAIGLSLQAFTAWGQSSYSSCTQVTKFITSETVLVCGIRRESILEKVLACLCVCVSHLVVSDSLKPHGLYPTRLLCPQNSPGKNTGVDCHSLLQACLCAWSLN